jgi:putative Mg2+ transporter-C (MgtC) family protein
MTPLTDHLVPLAVAVAIGLVLGLERELAHKPAGLRTQLLVTVGTTLFVLAARQLGGDGAERIAANVVTGLGFLGAGVILQHRGNVRGLTTAALVWVNGALGVAAASRSYGLAAAGVAVTLVAMRVLGEVERRMGQKCRVMQYQITARHSPALLEIVDHALAHCHYQDGPFGLDRRGDRVALRFGFCNPPARHQELVERLRSMPEVIELRLS